MKRVLAFIVVFSLVVGIFGGSSSIANASTQKENPAKQKIEELKDKGLDVQVNEFNGYTIVSGFDTEKLKNAKDKKADVGSLGAIYDVNAYQYIYYGYTYVGELNGSLEVERFSSTSIKIKSYNLTPENHNGTYERVDSSYYSPQTGNPAILYYNFSFLMKASYTVQNWVPFRCNYKVYPNGTVTFFNDGEA